MSYIILLFISFFTHWRWINPFAILTSGDWTYLSLSTMKEYLSLPYIWSTAGIGSVNIGMPFTPFEFLYGILAHFQLPYAIDEHIVFFWPIAITLPIASYLLIKKNIPSVFAAIVGSFVYTYNTYFGELQTGVLTLLIAYALAPLVLLLYQKTLEKKSFFYALLCGLTAFVVSFYEFRAFYVLFFVLFFYYIYYVSNSIRNISIWIRCSILAAVPFIIVFLLNLYWILPYIKTGTITSNYYFSRQLFGNQFTNINYAITLYHSFWTGSKTAIFVIQRIPIDEWIVPIAAFMGLILGRKKRNIYYFGFISLLGVFLTKQVGYPFTSVYAWLYQHFPGFNAFRESSKFYFLISLGYSILIAECINFLFTWRGTKLFRAFNYIVIIIIIAVFLINSRPMIMGDFGTLFTARNIPKDYVKVNNFLINQPDNFRVLWIPKSSRWIANTNIHPQINIVDMINTDWSLFIKHNSANSSYGEIADTLISSPNAGNLVSDASIKYIIVPLEDTKNDDNFFPDYGESRGYYINFLNRITWLKKINIGTSTVVVYKNMYAKPHIYVTYKKEIVGNSIHYQTLPFKYKNPTYYSFTLSHVKSPLYVNFSELYSPNWNIYIGNLNWYEGILSDPFAKVIFHSRSNTDLNSYFIDPHILCSLVSAHVPNNCIKNSDGTYTIHGEIFFSPQSYAYLGLIISFTSLAFTLFSLLYYGHGLFKKYD